GLIVYADGGWTLPSQLASSSLPTSEDDAIRARVSALRPLARWIAEAQSLASHDALTREDYGLLCAGNAADLVDQALSELVQRQLLSGNGRSYLLSPRRSVSLLSEQIGEARAREQHRALAALYERESPLAAAYHLLHGGEPERGLCSIKAATAGAI